MSTITRVLDPIIDVTNNRVTWHLPNNTILGSDIKMLNIGAIVDANARRYNRFAGGLSLIKNIYLTSNGVTVDQLLDANTWTAFTESQKTHSEAMSLSRTLIGNILGLHVGDGGKLGGAPDQTGKLINTELATSAKCMIDVSQLLPFLKASSMVPTTIFTNLRLTIEYDMSMIHVAGGRQDGTLTAMSTPFLVVEEMLDMDFIAKATADYRGLGFTCLERDQMFVNTNSSDNSDTDFTTDNKANSVSLESRAFQNKYVSRIVCAVKSLDVRAYLTEEGGQAVAAGGGGLGSVALLNPKFNVVVNGSNKVAGQGLVGATEIAGRLIDTWGASSTPTLAYTTSPFQDTEMYFNPQRYVGYMGWMGLSINDAVQSLYINLDYTAQFPTDEGTATEALWSRLNSDYNLLCFAECRKSIVVRPDKSFMISYM